MIKYTISCILGHPLSTFQHNKILLMNNNWLQQTKAIKNNNKLLIRAGIKIFSFSFENQY